MSFKIISISYLPALDGFRGIAILLVFMSHLGLGHIVPGGFGVTLFFYISGLLITRLLIAEYTFKEKINLKEFYIRRLLRLYPSLIFFIFTTFIVLISINVPFDLIDIVVSVFYFQNYYIVFFQSPNAQRFYDVLWSLAVEEHFYIVFPIILILFIRVRKVFLTILILACVFILFSRIYYINSLGVNAKSISINYFLTHTRADSILFGCISTLLLAIDSKRYFQFCSNYIILIVSGLLILICFIYRDNYFRETFRYTFQGLAFMVIIPKVIFDTKSSLLLKVLKSTHLIFIGKLSYSLYLFHWLALRTVDTLSNSNSDLTANLYLIAGALGIILSLINYYGIEIPMKQVRKYFGSTTV